MAAPPEMRRSLSRRERRAQAKRGGGAVDPGLREALGRVLQDHEAGRTTEAELGYRQILAQAPHYGAALHGLGQLLAQTGRPKEALPLLRQAAKVAPGHAGAQIGLGNALAALDRLEPAAAAYRKALDLDGALFDAAFNLANVLRRQGKAEAARAAFGRAIALAPERPEAFINLALMEADLGDLDEAEALLERALDVAPTAAAAHYNLGLVRDRKGDIAGAVAAYREAVSHDPTAANIRVNLGYALEELGVLDEAERSFERALALAPDYVEAEIGLAGLKHNSGRYDAAAEILRPLTERRPDHVRALVHLGLTEQERGNPGPAYAAFAQALENDPLDRKALANFAIAAQAAGKRDAAERIFDFDRLVSLAELPVPAGWPDLAAFNRDLLDHILRAPSLMPDRPGKSTTGGSQTLELLDGQAPVAVGFRAAVDQAVRRYLDGTVRPANDPHIGRPPRRWTLQSWAVVLRSGGHQSPHIHPEAVVSGVYYVQVPAAVAADGADNPGCLVFGQTKPWAGGADSQVGYLSRVVAPAAGRIVLFPSYFWHHTRPFESAATRVCVAFDVIRAG